MDILKRDMAPISTAAWDEIDETAKDVLLNTLTARRALTVNGPKGWDYNAVPVGRLEVIDEKKDGVCTGTYQIQKLVEARRSFTLNKWELDNIERGAKDIDLSPLEDAVKELALFEENAIYNGYKKGDIEGLFEAAEHKMKLGKDEKSLLSAVSQGVQALRESFADGPYDLVVSPDLYTRLTNLYEGYFLADAVKKLIGGEIFRSEAITGALLFPHKDEDIEFTVGQDFAVGYESDDAKTVTLFVTESMTLRVLDPAKVVSLK